jgi:hypothetical protein
MNKLQLYLSATQFAGTAVGKSLAEIATIRKDSFAATKLTTKHDQQLHDALFDDAYTTCLGMSKQLLPSEAAAVAAA